MQRTVKWSIIMSTFDSPQPCVHSALYSLSHQPFFFLSQMAFIPPELYNLCSLYPLLSLPSVLCPLFSLPSVFFALCPLITRSPSLIFLFVCLLLSSFGFRFPQPFVPTSLCSFSPLFPHPSVPSSLCSFIPMFPQSQAVPSLCSLSHRLSRLYVPSATGCPVSLFP